MRKLAGAIFAIVLMATAAGVWSSLGTAAGLIGAYDPALREQPSAAAQVADRFPRETERFRAFAFIQPPVSVEAVRPGARPPVMAGCAQSVWPFMAQQCLPAPAANAVRAPERAVVPERAALPERRTTGTAPVPVRTAAATAAAIPAAAATAAPTAAASSPACRQNLAAATARLEKALAHVKSLRGQRGDACTAYRQDFFDLVRAREMTALCKTGPERDQDLGRIDVAVEDINGAIAQSCGG